MIGYGPLEIFELQSVSSSFTSGVQPGTWGKKREMGRKRGREKEEKGKEENRRKADDRKKLTEEQGTKTVDIYPTFCASWLVLVTYYIHMELSLGSIEGFNKAQAEEFSSIVQDGYDSPIILRGISTTEQGLELLSIFLSKSLTMSGKNLMARIQVLLVAKSPAISPALQSFS